MSIVDGGTELRRELSSLRNQVTTVTQKHALASDSIVVQLGGTTVTNARGDVAATFSSGAVVPQTLKLMTTDVINGRLEDYGLAYNSTSGVLTRLNGGAFYEISVFAAASLDGTEANFSDSFTHAGGRNDPYVTVSLNVVRGTANDTGVFTAGTGLGDVLTVQKVLPKRVTYPLAVNATVNVVNALGQVHLPNADFGTISDTTTGDRSGQIKDYINAVLHQLRSSSSARVSLNTTANTGGAFVTQADLNASVHNAYRVNASIAHLADTAHRLVGTHIVDLRTANYSSESDALTLTLAAPVTLRMNGDEGGYSYVAIRRLN